MKKLLWTVGAIFVAGMVLADSTNGVKKARRHYTKEELARVMANRYGGYLVQPGTPKGRLVYVNCTKAVGDDRLKQNAETFRSFTKLTIDVEKGEFAFPTPKIHGEASLFVVDDSRLPPLLTAPENRWVMVNVANLRTGAGEKSEFFEARVQKELTRGFALLAGSQDSNYPHSLLGAITKPEQLDEYIDCRLPVDIKARLVKYVAGYGIVPRIDSDYTKACKAGWAPAPTNKLQQAIWDKVHAVPKNPMKIEFDPKKGR